MSAQNKFSVQKLFGACQNHIFGKAHPICRILATSAGEFAAFMKGVLLKYAAKRAEPSKIGRICFVSSKQILPSYFLWRSYGHIRGDAHRQSGRYHAARAGNAARGGRHFLRGYPPYAAAPQPFRIKKPLVACHKFNERAPPAKADRPRAGGKGGRCRHRCRYARRVRSGQHPRAGAARGRHRLYPRSRCVRLCRGAGLIRLSGRSVCFSRIFARKGGGKARPFAKICRF